MQAENAPLTWDALECSLLVGFEKKVWQHSIGGEAVKCNFYTKKIDSQNA